MSRHDAATRPEKAAWSTRAVDADAAVDYHSRAAESLRRRLTDSLLSRFRRRDRLRELWGLRPVGQTGERREGDSVPRVDFRGSDPEYLYVLFQRRGTGIVTQAGRSAEIRSGQVVIYDSRQPFTLDYREPYEQVVVHLPAERVFADAGLRPSTDLFAVPIDVDGALSAVSAFFQSLADTQASDPVGTGFLAPHAAGLASSLLAYAARTGGPQDLPILLQRERVLAYLRQHLSDADLDVDRIAVGCHISRRTLHRLFEGTGHTVMSHLRTLRVDAAQRMLANQADLRSNRSPRRWGSSATPTSTARSGRLPV